MNRLPLARRRAQLIEAALRVASHSGVEAVTIRAVAHEAGVSLGTVHYCFEDKDELLEAMGQSIRVEASDQINAIFTAAGDAGLDFATLAHQCADALLAGLKRYRQVRLLLLEMATTGARNTAMRPTALAHLEQSTQMALGLVTACAEAAGITYRVDAAQVARSVTALIDGVELAWLLDGDDERALEGFHALADLLVVYALEPPAGWPSTAST
ncbi:TetR family transcriptional regulator [Xylanimonas allomyrinae]|uniref:TetR family transcriptional regulator n=1 Tax=Xylanimonas allomyrinae TaxID=2509459 RepID=A0A4P6ETF4_9MICO|nr:TetR family transcriptional regulator [Xylanimonas allomyrinae]QAY63647.1 TetR family transcriptional regulator [Xylanimonas allomyrinae]